MLNTNALVGIGLVIVSNFANVVPIDEKAVPRSVADLERVAIAENYRWDRSTLFEIILIGRQGARFGITDGTVTLYRSPDCYWDWGGHGDDERYFGKAALSSEEILSLATKAVRSATPSGSPVDGVGPLLNQMGEPSRPLPIYQVHWPSTNNFSKRLAIVEVDARKGFVSYFRLTGRAFIDQAGLQKLRDRVYLPDPALEPPAMEEEPAANLQQPPTNQVVQAITSWLSLCRKLGVDPGPQTNVDLVDWQRTLSYTNASVSMITPVCVIRFQNGTAFEAIGEAAFSHYSRDACFSVYGSEGPLGDVERFKGRIIKNGQELIQALPRRLITEFGLNPDVMLSAKAIPRDFPPVGSQGLKRVRVNWRTFPNHKGVVRAEETTLLFSAELDLETGRLIWISFHDPSLVGAVMKHTSVAGR
jgi:hypothetical protein